MSIEELRKKTEYYDLRVELEKIAERGLGISIEGVPASPHIIAEACVLREGCSYMRDYEIADTGNVISIDFVRVS